MATGQSNPADHKRTSPGCRLLRLGPQNGPYLNIFSSANPPSTLTGGVDPRARAPHRLMLCYLLLTTLWRPPVYNTFNRDLVLRLLVVYDFNLDNIRP